MDYKSLLENSYLMTQKTFDCWPESRLQFIGDYIFDFTTYDDEMTELFARKALEVCAAISNGTTFKLVKDPEKYQWYLLMCNMPFFAGRLNWGSSIRGAWWDTSTPNHTELESLGLWAGEEQLTKPLKFSTDQWREFIDALVAFGFDDAPASPNPPKPAT